MQIILYSEILRKKYKKMSNFNGKQQLKFKYYVSTSQPDQIGTSMGRKGKFFEGSRQHSEVKYKSLESNKSVSVYN